MHACKQRWISRQNCGYELLTFCRCNFYGVIVSSPECQTLTQALLHSYKCSKFRMQIVFGLTALSVFVVHSRSTHVHIWNLTLTYRQIEKGRRSLTSRLHGAPLSMISLWFVQDTLDQVWTQWPSSIAKLIIFGAVFWKCITAEKAC